MRKMILVLALNLLLSGRAEALTTRTITTTADAPLANPANNEVILEFPETATFRAAFTGEVDITSIVLEYGNEAHTCGEVIAKAFPQFTPGKTVRVDWTWEMRQSGSLPPGATLWWRWRVTDANGNETVSETKTATWLDDIHDWRTINNGDSQSVRIHWYEGDQSFATDLANAAYNGLQFNETQSGLKASAPVDIYIYANTDDLKEAVLYEPSWTGGQAFPDQDIVILGISPSDLDWGRDAIVHELTHVLVGHLTFSCLGDVPTWLNEGLAVYSEGELDPVSQAQLEESIRADTLFPIRSLSGSFSEVSDQAYLSYSQSYSITKFLIETYGQDKMTILLLALREGLTIDEALSQTYGFDIDGLEAAWRQAVGAQPRPTPLGAYTQATAQPTPTFVPTIVPVSGVPVAQQITPMVIPTSSFQNTPATGVPIRTGPPLALSLILLGLCCVMLLLIGVVVLGLVLRRKNGPGGENVQ